MVTRVLKKPKSEPIVKSVVAEALCANCDEPIGIARHKAHPTAITCIACAELLDKQKRTRHAFGPGG